MLNWDPGNAATFPDSEPFPKGYDLLPKKRIGHCHAKNVMRKPDGKWEWAPVGTGVVDWAGQLAALRARRLPLRRESRNPLARRRYTGSFDSHQLQGPEGCADAKAGTGLVEGRERIREPDDVNVARRSPITCSALSRSVRYRCCDSSQSVQSTGGVARSRLRLAALLALRSDSGPSALRSWNSFRVLLVILDHQRDVLAVKVRDLRVAASFWRSPSCLSLKGLWAARLRAAGLPA